MSNASKTTTSYSDSESDSDEPTTTLHAKDVKIQRLQKSRDEYKKKALMYEQMMNKSRKLKKTM